jgi:hypothetical protein
MHHDKKAASPGDGSLYCTGSLTQVGACIPYLSGKSREKAKKGFVFSIGKPFEQGVGKKCRSSGMRLAYYVIWYENLSHHSHGAFLVERRSSADALDELGHLQRQHR